jgi:hypothetical protein
MEQSSYICVHVNAAGNSIIVSSTDDMISVP